MSGYEHFSCEKFIRGFSYLVRLSQAQPHTLPQSSKPLQDHVDDITQSTSVEFALYSLPKPFDSGDDGWTDKNMAELETALGLALEE
jgi:hypothetical protein